MVRLTRFSSSDEGPINRDLGWDRGFQEDEDFDEITEIPLEELDNEPDDSEENGPGETPSSGIAA